MKQICQHGWEQCSVCHDKSGQLWPKTGENKMSKDYVPDAKKHLIASLFKSILRILGYLIIGLALDSNAWAVFAVVILILSEGFGLLEEFV